MKTALILFAFFSLAASQAVLFDSLPQSFQLYARDKSDSATVAVKGTLLAAGHDSLVLSVKKNGADWKRSISPVKDLAIPAVFAFRISLHAELSEYAFRVYLDDSLVAASDSVVCGDAFMIDGQSNAEASGGIWQYYLPASEIQWSRTAYYQQSLPDSAYSAQWLIANGECCIRNGIGQFGFSLAHFLTKNYQVPVCIINGAVSGSQIQAHQKDTLNPVNTATIYGRILLRARVSGLQNQIRGIIYYQGEFHYPWFDYAALFDSLLSSWKTDFPAVERYYIEQIHTGCNEYAGSVTVNTDIRELQRKFGENYTNFVTMAVCGAPQHNGCHFGTGGYLQIAEWLGQVMGRDFYAEADTENITSPRIRSAGYADSSGTIVDLLFDQPVAWPQDTLGYAMKDYVTFDSAYGLIDSARTFGSRLRLYLNAPCSAKTVSYIPLNHYRGLPAADYEGPWLRNPRGIGALTFLNFPISDTDPMPVNSASDSENLSSWQLEASPNPFNPVCRVFVQVPSRSKLSIEVFDASGRIVKSIMNGPLIIGRHSFEWNATDQNSRPVSSGLYCFRMTAGNKTLTAKVLLTR